MRAAAQEGTDPADTARFRFGPLRFTPGILVSNVGVDTNVFNEPVDPKRDRTAVVGPGVRIWMNVGRSRVSGTAQGQYLYFETFRNQRAWNSSNDLKWEVPLARLTPFISGSYSNSKSRPGYEIDTRVRTLSQGVTLGTSLRLSGRTNVTLRGSRSHNAYGDSATFLETDLSTALNQAANSQALELRYRLTSLTSLVVTGEAIQDRFEFDRLRDANSVRVLSGFELKPAALISGKVAVGYRRFEPLTSMVPEYQGLAAAVDAKLTARAVQIGAAVARDLSYSFQATNPYYILSDVALSVTYRISDAWDVVAQTSQQTLDYVRLRVVAPPTPDDASPAGADGQSLRIRQYGAGFGYRLGRTLRLGIDGVYFRRGSFESSLREYEGTRIGASISYGSTQ